MPDVDDPERLRAFFGALGELRQADLVLAYHDRSDGGLFVTLAEMAFAGHAGLEIDLDGIASGARDVLGTLFAEELGAVVQVSVSHLDAVLAVVRGHGLAPAVLGSATTDDVVRFRAAGHEVLAETRIDLQRAWSETTHALQSLRDNPDSAREEFDRILDREAPGLSPSSPSIRRRMSRRPSSPAAPGLASPSCGNRA